MLISHHACSKVTLATVTMGVISGFSIFFGVMVRCRFFKWRALFFDDALSVLPVICPYPSLQGLRGIREHDPKKLWFFYLWKLGRFCFESMLLFTDMFQAPGLAASWAVLHS